MSVLVVSPETIGTMGYTGHSMPTINDPIPHKSESATPMRLTSTNEATAFNTNRCSAIIQALQVQSWSTELQTFNNVTPKDFKHISDERSDWIYPKFYYNPKHLRLTAMVPTVIHELAIQSLQKSMMRLTVPYDTNNIQFYHLPNSEIQGEQAVIPDLRLDLATYYESGEQPVTVWVGECGVSQTWEDMELKLARAIQNAPTIDAVFMLKICETKTSRDPDRSLACQPRLSYADFTAPFKTLPIPHLSPIVVGDVVWANIKSIELMVFIRGDNGKFNFKIHSGNFYAACGLLYPRISVEHVTRLLDTAARRLLTTVADTMENHHDSDHGRIHALRNAAEVVTFPIQWNEFLRDIQGGLYSTAFSRYEKWFNENH